MSETEVVNAVYAGLNSNNIPSALRDFDPEVVRIEWEGSPEEQTFRGLAAVTEHFHQGRSTWAEGGCEPERMLVAGNKILVFVHVRVRVKGRTEWNEGRVFDGFAFRNGKIIHMQSFLNEQEARAWAGVKDGR